MTVVAIMLVVRMFGAVICVNNEQYLRGFVLALNELVCLLCTETF